MQPLNLSSQTILPLKWRIRLWYGAIILITMVFLVRLFYLQVIRHEYYQTAATNTQLKEAVIPASRGIIEAHLGDSVVPIVLNDILYTVFADPLYVKDPGKAALAVAAVTGGDANEYQSKIAEGGKAGLRYVILAKKQSEKTQQAVADLKLKGIGTRANEYRTYPQGSLASQLLGFVNDEGIGKYGLEQALNSELEGTPGQLKAITDAQGVPLATNRENLLIEPKSGQRLLLTIDIGLQEQVEALLKAGLDRAQSKTGSAVVLEVGTGRIKAMANFPTYDPSQYNQVEDASLFNNAAVSTPIEFGSTMKPFTAAAALNQGVVSRSTTYFDPSVFKIDTHNVTNIEEDGGPGTKSVADILQLSLNTGATWLLMQMGGGEINKTAREKWFDYLTNHYQFGKATGIEQGYEGAGIVPDPNDGFGLNIQYANTSFGQGITTTPLQMAAALDSMINGGTYYRPHLIDKLTADNGTETVKAPEAVKTEVVTETTSKNMIELMTYVFSKNKAVYGMPHPPAGYIIGGKTGTAEIPNPEQGGYYDDRFNGTYIGFVGAQQPKYVVVVSVIEPHIGGYAGAKAAAPLFVDIVNNLIDKYGVN